jgi:cyclophilin family peptidyl-prolyl cis-trans isomerase
VILGLLFIGTIGFVTYQNQSDQIVADPSASAPETPEPVSISTNAPIPGCQEPAVVRADNITFGSVTSDLPTASEFNIETNCGAIKFAADANAPKTVGTIAWLANQGFYNNTSCHRLTTQGIFVLQCGDPAGDGTGSPGFKFDDENLPTAGADGTFVYTGFKPAFIMVKATGGTEGWVMLDNKRANTFNAVNGRLRANSSAAEETNVVVCDFVSNGFKFRYSDGAWNSSSYSYIYMAFAENPFVTSGGIPVTAR